MQQTAQATPRVNPSVPVNDERRSVSIAGGRTRGAEGDPRTCARGRGNPGPDSPRSRARPRATVSSSTRSPVSNPEAADRVPRDDAVGDIDASVQQRLEQSSFRLARLRVRLRNGADRTVELAHLYNPLPPGAELGHVSPLGTDAHELRDARSQIARGEAGTVPVHDLVRAFLEELRYGGATEASFDEREGVVRDLTVPLREEAVGAIGQTEADGRAPDPTATVAALDPTFRFELLQVAQRGDLGDSRHPGDLRQRGVRRALEVPQDPALGRREFARLVGQRGLAHRLEKGVESLYTVPLTNRTKDPTRGMGWNDPLARPRRGAVS